MISNFIEKAKRIHHNKFDYSLVNYKNAKTKVIIICPIHGEFLQTPNNHLSGRGCKLCADLKKTNSLKDTVENFILKANIIHNNKYDYSKVIYKNAKTKVVITCPIHGVFAQTPDNHLHGQACPVCRGRRHFDTKIFIEESSKLYQNKYDYSLVKYQNARTKVKIICPEHGIFEQTPSNHLNGHECQLCKHNKKLGKELFIKMANKIHNNCYLYENLEYINSKTKIKITCKIHGIFEQTPNNHLNGNKCPFCAKSQISIMSQKWLDSFNNKNMIKEKFLKINSKRYKVDGFDPITKTVYEFYGDFWHGNPNKFNGNDLNEINKIAFGELYNKTIEREILLKKAGYNIISIWESDFIKGSINNFP